MQSFTTWRGEKAGRGLATLLPLILPALTAAPPALGQTAEGFSAEAVWTERSQLFSVRGFASDPRTGDLLVAIGNTVFRDDLQGTRLTVHGFAAGDDVGALVHTPGDNRAWFTAVRAGTLVGHDLTSGASTTFPGVPNTFDLTVTAGGAVLASANPGWPAPGSASGVWLLGTGAPREIIRMRGPSGPLLALPDGSLLVADLGTTVPPAPGSVRILRFDAGLVAQAVAGVPGIHFGNATVALGGLDGAFDLARDGRGRLYVTDPNAGAVLRTAPGSGNLDPTPLTNVNGGALQMELVPGSAPMLPWQPGDRAESLLLASSDFASEYRVQRIAPARPELIAPGSPTGAGPVRLGVRRAPAGGLAVLAFQFSPLQRERVVANLRGIPVWLALDTHPLAPIVTTVLPLDPSGAASLSVQHPGGFGFSVHMQAIALRAAGGGLALGTTPATTLNLLP